MKALKELAQQRKKLEKVLNEIKKTTRQSISRLEMRVKNMEAAARIKSEYGEFPEFVSQGGGSPSHKSENKQIQGSGRGGNFEFQILTKTRKERERENRGVSAVFETSANGVSSSSSNGKVDSRLFDGENESYFPGQGDQALPSGPGDMALPSGPGNMTLPSDPGDQSQPEVDSRRRDGKHSKVC